MPSEISELPQFFDTIEKLYQIYQVPDDLRAKLLIPKLSSRAKSIIVRMTAEDLDRYDEVTRWSWNWKILNVSLLLASIKIDLTLQ